MPGGWASRWGCLAQRSRGTWRTLPGEVLGECAGGLSEVYCGLCMAGVSFAVLENRQTLEQAQPSVSSPAALHLHPLPARPLILLPVPSCGVVVLSSALAASAFTPCLSLFPKFGG